MTTKDDTMIAFYQVLGRLFFAAAQADGIINKEEVITLKKVVKDVWIDIDETFDEFNSDSPYQIEIVFDYLNINKIVVDGVIDELKEFKSIHSSLFTDKINQLILSTSNRIVLSFAQKNKSELVFYLQLQIALKK